jgi:hypothetical protein
MYFNQFFILTFLAIDRTRGSSFDGQLSIISPHDHVAHSIDADRRECLSKEIEEMPNRRAGALAHVEMKGKGMVGFSKIEGRFIEVSTDGQIGRIKKCDGGFALAHLGWVSVQEDVADDTISDYMYFMMPNIEPVSIPSISQNANRKYEITADLLLDLKRIHFLGLYLGTLDEDLVIGSDGTTGRAKFRLEFSGFEAFLRDENYTFRIETQRRYKSDIQDLVELMNRRDKVDNVFELFDSVRTLPDWKDPFLVLEDAAFKARESFDYDKWSDFFRKLSKSNDEQVRTEVETYWNARIPDPRIKHSALSDDYWPLMRSCMSDLQESDCSGVDSIEKCVEPNTFTLIDGAENLVLKTDPESAKEGSTCLAFPSADETKFLKISRNICGIVDKSEPYENYREEEKQVARDRFKMRALVKKQNAIKLLCNERAVLGVLKGLKGQVPVEYPIESPSQPMCAKISLLTESAGMYAFENNLSGLSPSQLFKSVARLIGILKDFNKAGFIHNDFHLFNVLFSDMSNPADTLKLIDFGYSVPIRDEHGYTCFVGGRSNLMQLDFMSIAYELGRMLRPSDRIPEQFVEFIRPFLEEFFGDIDSLGVFETLDYDKWIRTFNDLADQTAYLG